MRIVLVEPQRAANVGAVARAMRNTGLEDLAIVRPAAYDPEAARWMAPGCEGLLAGARIVGSIEEALIGTHHVVAATARHRRIDVPVLGPDELASEIRRWEGRVSILFGREDHGLANADVERARAILRIPTPEHASLNLSQAVLIAAYAHFTEGLRQGTQASGRTLAGSGSPTTTRELDARRDAVPADLAQLEPAANAVVALLDRVGYLRRSPRARVHATIRQVLQRTAPTEKEVAALFGMVNQIGWALDHGRER